MVIICGLCQAENEFAQPYPYHAGFGNQGFLYNDGGNSTLVWSSFDPAYEEIVGKTHPWVLSDALRAKLESLLPASPKGDLWRFANPARCIKCHNEISPPIGDNIYYLEYPESVILDTGPDSRKLRDYLGTSARAT
jgi:hypothetical protein